ncbi:MAG: hypothetical protein ACLS9F_19030 [Clostridium paraputrificum]
MDKTILQILKGLIILFQGAGGICFVFCLLTAGFKMMWKKQTRSEVKDDLLWAFGGLVLVVLCFPLGEFIQSKITF